MWTQAGAMFAIEIEILSRVHFSVPVYAGYMGICIINCVTDSSGKQKLCPFLYFLFDFVQV